MINFDLLIVNLYPWLETKSINSKKIIEMIEKGLKEIKDPKHCNTLIDPNDYLNLKNLLKLLILLIKYLQSKHYEHANQYDQRYC